MFAFNLSRLKHIVSLLNRVQIFSKLMLAFQLWSCASFGGNGEDKGEELSQEVLKYDVTTHFRDFKDALASVQRSFA